MQGIERYDRGAWVVRLQPGLRCHQHNPGGLQWCADHSWTGFSGGFAVPKLKFGGVKGVAGHLLCSAQQAWIPHRHTATDTYARTHTHPSSRIATSRPNRHQRVRHQQRQLRPDLHQHTRQLRVFVQSRLLYQSDQLISVLTYVGGRKCIAC